MNDFVAELEATLAALGTPDADRTTIIPAAAAPAPRPREPRRPRARRRSLGPLIALALGLAAIGGGTVAYLALKDGGGGSPAGVTVPIRLVASAAYDPPPGDGQEHDDEVARASDGDPATFWETERYRSVNFGGLKSGVGIVLDAGEPVQPREIVVVTDTPGFVAEIKAGAAPRPPFAVVSSSRTVQTRTTLPLALTQPQQYFLLWITRLAPGYERTHVNEVSAE
jgi:hypothetical protein